MAASLRETSLSFSRTEADQRLEALRSTLDDSERTLLVLRVDRRMPWDEIAQVLGGDAAALRKRFQRLKDRLRREAA